MLRCLFIFVLGLSAMCAAESLPVHNADNANDADHQALRTLRDELVAALNATDYARLGQCLAPGFSLTFADQRRFTDLAALASYQKHLHEEIGITKVHFAPEVDAPALLITTDTAVATGMSNDRFEAKDGSFTAITSRWTATMVRRDGAWKLSAFQAGVDLMDNPILHRQRQAFIRFAVFGSVLCLIVGLLSGWWFGRRRV